MSDILFQNPWAGILVAWGMVLGAVFFLGGRAFKGYRKARAVLTRRSGLR